MCIRTYIEEYCTKCHDRVSMSCGVDPCWWQTLSGACEKETMQFKKIMVVGCSNTNCRYEEFEYSSTERNADYAKEKWFDDDPDKRPQAKPKYYWKNSMPEAYVRKVMGDEEYEKWKAQEWKEEEERKEAAEWDKKDEQERRWNGISKKTEEKLEFAKRNFTMNRPVKEPEGLGHADRWIMVSQRKVEKLMEAEDDSGREGDESG